MAQGMKLTQLGKKVLALALAGENLNFTCIKIGSGDFDYDAESVFDLTDLRHYEMTLPITKCEAQGDGTVYLEAYLSNAEVYQGFACREHGIYCIDPATGDEILYSYVNVGNDYDFIPSNVGTATKNIFVGYLAEINDAENITAKIDLSVAFINTEDFKDHINSKHPHPNIPNHLDDIADADYIWATDIDDNLHKLSIDNFKNLLTNGATEGVANHHPISELGLDANILIFEDFTGESVTDNLKIKVTSSAQGGNLLGVESVDNLKTGAFYTIADGYNQETIQVAGIRYNVSGYHIKLQKPLDYSYDLKSTYLYRTTNFGADKRVVDYLPAEGFEGVSANITRLLHLEMTGAIEGDGFVRDDFFTLA